MANSRDQKFRREIAAEAARLIASEGPHDFLSAKRKAATHLGISETRFMPGNREIQRALSDYQQMFQSASHPNHIRSLRETALQAMKTFAAFQPRLVGDVLDGFASQYSEITLHIFSDTVEEIFLFLIKEQISHQTAKVRLRVARDQYREYPVFRLTAGEHGISLLVFPINGQRQSPFSPIDGKPMRRASLTTVQEILADPA